MDEAFPQIMKKNVEVVRMSSRSASRNVCAQLVEVPVPQNCARDRRAGEFHEQSCMCLSMCLQFLHVFVIVKSSRVDRDVSTYFTVWTQPEFGATRYLMFFVT